MARMGAARMAAVVSSLVNTGMEALERGFGLQDVQSRLGTSLWLPLHAMEPCVNWKY